MTEPRTDRPFKAFDAAFLLLVPLLLVAGRWESVVYPCRLNPDEAQMAANAMRIWNYGISWDAVDGTTSGPLNSLVLAWPYLFGGDVTLSTTRLTALAILAATVWLVYRTVAAVRGRLVATLLSLSLAAFYAFTRISDLLQYASEILSVSLLLLANNLLVEGYLRAHDPELPRWKFFAAGVAIGCVPFAKLQAVPIAAVEVAFALLTLAQAPSGRRGSRLVAFVGGGLLPAAVWLIPLLLKGALVDFIQGYIIAALQHLNHGRTDGIATGQVLGLVSEDPILMSLLYLVGASALFSVLYRDRDKAHRHEHALVLTSYAVLQTVAGLFAIMIRGKAFYHYLLFLPPFVVLIAGYWAYSPRRNPRYLIAYAVTYLLALGGVGILLVVTDYGGEKSLSHFVHRYRTPVTSSFAWHAPRTLQWLTGSSDRLLVWGWMPEWYLWSGLPPATRESITQMQILPGALSDYYRHRLMTDLAGSQPDFIIDAVAGKAFGVTDWLEGDSGILSNPALANLLHASFEALPDAHSRDNPCATLYVRRQRLAEARRHLVEFARITGSPHRGWASHLYSESNVDDGQVTEDACIDYWLLPDGELGELRIDFTRPERVGRVLIMNTADGTKQDRATDRVRVELLDRGQVTYATELALRRHPEWTQIDLGTPHNADALRIEILSFLGAGAGLNEVKVLRAGAP